MSLCVTNLHICNIKSLSNCSPWYLKKEGCFDLEPLVACGLGSGEKTDRESGYRGEGVGWIKRDSC